MSDTMVGLGVVNAPPAQPPLVGLLAALAVLGPNWLVDDEVEDVTDIVNGADGAEFAAPSTISQRWVGGFSYLPEQVCTSLGVTDPCAPAALAAPAQPDVVHGIPALVRGGDICSTIGFGAHDYRGRALRALLASESKQIAAELWTGTQAQASGWPNMWLASSAAEVLTSSAVDPGPGLALLEQGLADFSNGQQGMIHCTRQMGSALSELGNTFRSVNGQILTYTGTVICPDVGYPGTSPAGAAPSAGKAWAYATLMPQVRRSPVELIPDTFEEAIYRLTNSLEIFAQRYATATFPPCCLVAAEINLPTLADTT